MVLSAAPRGRPVHPRPSLPDSFTQYDGVLAGLQSETERELFFTDLLERGRELTRQGQGSVASGVFDYLRAQEKAPAAVRQAAQSEWDLGRGGGPLGLRLERSLDHFLDQVTAPELLVGMGVASMGFGLGRLAGMGMVRASGFGGEAVLWGGRVMGLATEATAFVGAGRATSKILGRSRQGFWEDFGADWLHALGMVGALRVSRWGVQKFYGAGWTPRHSWDRVAYQSQQGLAELLTLGSVNYAMTPHSDFLLTDTLAQWLTFHGAGRISRQLWGARWRGLERRLVLEAQAMEAEFAAPSLGSPMILMAMAGNGSGGPRTPRPRMTPKRTQRTPPQGSMGTAGRAGRPWTVNSTQHLIGYLKAPRLRLPHRLQTEHFYFEMGDPKALDVDALQRFLNGLDNLAQIPGGRLLSVRFLDGSPTVDFMKLGPTFHTKYRKPTPQTPGRGTTTPPQEVPRRRSTPAEEQITEMREVSRRMDRLRSSNPPSAPKRMEVGPDEGRIPHLLETPRDLAGLLTRMQRQGFQRANRPVILLGSDITPEQLAHQSQGRVTGFPQNLFLELWVPELRKTFVGRLQT
ncbi:MAG: hypothetical protein R3257_06795, partial [bacterium]|nr:hypothetical protein [bacterium]